MPAVSETPLRILVVCVGNICRSPLGERLLQARLGGSALVTSAGVGARAGLPMDEAAAAELVRLGGDPVGFTSRVATQEVLEGADLVLTMTKDIRTEVLRRAPRLMKRTFTMAEFAAICAALPEVEGDVVLEAARHRSRGAGAPDVEDPYRRAPEVHRRVADHISTLVDQQLPVLRPHRRLSRASATATMPRLVECTDERSETGVSRPPQPERRPWSGCGHLATSGPSLRSAPTTR